MCACTAHALGKAGLQGNLKVSPKRLPDYCIMRKNIELNFYKFLLSLQFKAPRSYLTEKHENWNGVPYGFVSEAGKKNSQLPI